MCAFRTKATVRLCVGESCQGHLGVQETFTVVKFFLIPTFNYAAPCGFKKLGFVNNAVYSFSPGIGDVICVCVSLCVCASWVFLFACLLALFYSVCLFFLVSSLSFLPSFFYIPTTVPLPLPPSTPSSQHSLLLVFSLQERAGLLWHIKL